MDEGKDFRLEHRLKSRDVSLDIFAICSGKDLSSGYLRKSNEVSCLISVPFHCVLLGHITKRNLGSSNILGNNKVKAHPAILSEARLERFPMLFGKDTRLRHLLMSSEVRLERFPMLSGKDTR